jgi:hypothetical protein
VIGLENLGNDYKVHIKNKKDKDILVFKKGDSEKQILTFDAYDIIVELKEKVLFLIENTILSFKLNHLNGHRVVIEFT